MSYTRHPLNRNLKLFQNDTYRGFKVQAHRGPLVEQYLEALCMTLHSALAEHRRTLAIRIDLRYPQNYEILPGEGRSHITRFIESFKSQIRANRQRASRHNKNNTAHQTSVRYVWCKEYGKDMRPHYHVLILLSGDAYYCLGDFDGSADNLYGRASRAWERALGIPSEQASGLVQIPDNAQYRVCRDDLEMVGKVFTRASYLCKAATKMYENLERSFGCSRN